MVCISRRYCVLSLCSNGKVVPIKPLSIPRLQLCCAAIWSKLVQVLSSLDIRILCWLKNNLCFKSHCSDSRFICKRLLASREHQINFDKNLLFQECENDAVHIRRWHPSNTKYALPSCGLILFSPRSLYLVNLARRARALVFTHRRWLADESAQIWYRYVQNRALLLLNQSR